MMYDSRIPQSAIPVARETLAQSDAMRGLSAMTPPNTGMTNMDDGGAYTNAAGTMFGQMQERAAQATQEMAQNFETAQRQQNVAGRGMAIKMNTENATQKGEAQLFLNSQMANVLDSRGGGQALMQFAALNQSPEGAAMRNSVLTTQAMRDQLAPELGAEAASAAQYGLA